MVEKLFYIFWVLVKTVIRELWWFFLFIILLRIYLNLKAKKKKKEEKENEKIKEWETFEIIVNPYILQSPKAMEQVFNGLHALGKGYLVLEILGYKQEVHFFIHAPKGNQKFIEAQFYAQYPDIEIIPTKDYFLSLPPILPNKEFNIWGAEIILEKESAYPIRTYEYFEDPKEEKRIDPVANFIESISNADKNECFVFQLIIKPLVKDKEKEFRAKATSEINIKLGKKEKKSATWEEWVFAFFRNLLVGIIEPPIWPDEEKKSSEISISISSLPTSEREVIEAISKKNSLLAFEAGIRIFYFAPYEVFSETNIASFLAYLKQFSVKHLNSFTINEETLTKVGGSLFKERRLFLKKLSFYKSLKEKNWPKKAIVLSSQELATIYHFPLVKVKSPALVRGVFRKGEPPFNLPR